MTVEAQDRTREARTAEVVEAAKRLAPLFAERAAEHDRDASFPFENFQHLRDARLLNLTVPADRGGDGLGVEAICRVVQEIATGEPSTALVLSMQYLQRAGAARSGKWPADVYDRVTRESVEGISLINAARVEPELGTPARGGLPATIARKVPGGWRITGRKIYTTGSPILSYAVVWSRTDEEPVRLGGILVPMDAPGVRTEKTWNHLGMRATGSDDLVLEDVLVPAENALDLRTQEEWKNAAGEREALVQNGAVIAALYQGVAIAARNWLVGYLNERTPTNLGAPLSTLPRFQAAVGEIEALLYVNDRLIFGLAEAADTGSRPIKPGEAGLVKTIVTENVVKATSIALELTGNPGLSRENPLERHYRDALCGRVHTPQADVVFGAAGRTALNPPPPRS